MFETLIFILSLCSDKCIVIDLGHFKWTAYENYNVVKSGPASGGRRGCLEKPASCKTPIGIFKVIVKKGRYYRSPIYPMEKINGVFIPCKGKKCSPMPWAVKFRHAGESIHGAKNDNFTKHFSHGCVHTTYIDAQWINYFVKKNTNIIILPY